MGSEKSEVRSQKLKEQRRSLTSYFPLLTSHFGFTLIELALVLFVIGLVVAMTFPKLTRFGRGDLKLTSRHLIHTVQLLVDRAEATKRLYRLNYDLKKQEYWATVLQPLSDAAAEFVPVDSTLLRRVSLKEPIRLSDVITLRQGKVTEGEAYTQFYPNGLVDRTLFHLTDQAQETITLIIHPLTGRVKVLEGYVEEK